MKYIVLIIIAIFFCNAATGFTAPPLPERFAEELGYKIPKSEPYKRLSHDPDIRRSSFSLADDGVEKVAVILVDFPDRQGTRSRNSIADTILSTSPGVKSMSNYYDEVSYGQLSVIGEASPGWYRMPRNMTYYGANGFNGNDRWLDDFLNGFTDGINFVQTCLELADADFDFSGFDRDNNGVVDHVMIIHAGNDEASSSSQTDIWSVSVSGGSGFGTYDGVRVAAVTVGAEDPDRPALPMGTYAHEFFHDLGAPDLYDYGDDGVEGVPVGLWDLMSFGNYQDSGRTPCHMGSFLKYDIDGIPGNGINGWMPLNFVDASGTYQVNQLSAGGNDLAYRIPTKSSLEYFIVENRQQTGFDEFLPAEGILIWHIDTRNKQEGFNDGVPYYSAWIEDPEDPDHIDHLLEGAAYSLESGNRGYSPFTVPDSYLNTGAQSGISIYDIGSSSETMSFTVGFDDEPQQSENIYAYPNPFPQSGSGVVTFKNLPAEARVKIYDIAGDRVIELPTGQDTWDARNADGREVANGLYIYVITGGGVSVTGKLAVKR
jgi:M6 family metalloprotease-like protein